MTDTATPDDLSLTDIMLTMDVVDSLRHEEALVERALNAKAREALMIERVREAYAAQGIVVSDETIAAGVKALKEKQFVYEPPAPGLKTRLLRAWVNRRGIGRGLGLFAGVGAVIAGGWWGFVELPQARALATKVEVFNRAVQVANVDVTTLQQRHSSLVEALAAVPSDVPNTLARGFGQIREATQEQLDTADRTINEASQLVQTATYSTDNYARLGAPAERQLQAQLERIAQAQQALDSAESNIARLRGLRGLPRELRALRDEALDVAVPASVDREIESIYAAGEAALRAGDAQTATAQADLLKSTLRQLETVYRVSIVSRPGVRSGVIRYPEGNESVDNYYLIVEALSSSGTALTIDVVSEEDGSRSRQKLWGLRVSEAVFNQVGRDKQADGIVDNKLVGEKRRGYLEPDYAIDTTGARISEWDN